MDIESYTKAAVQGVPLLFVVFGLVAWAKSFGLQGNGLRAVSMVIGLLLGVGYLFATLGFPVNFAGWFTVIVYGLGLGVVASGVYDGLKAVVKQ
jgi:hypothetical protein